MASRRETWRRRVSNLFLISGSIILFAVALVWVQAQVIAQQIADTRYMASHIEVALALPPLTPTPTQTVALRPTATPTPQPQPIVRITIPKLQVERAVVPVGMRPDSQGNLQWDTDSLFATRNRPDLVGQLVGSDNPGQGGNIILTGHNYNEGRYNWKGVFIDLQKLQPGDVIQVNTQDGREFNYHVQQTTSVPWRNKDEAELAQHLAFLGQTAAEQLTLVTCGGANIWPFPARVYVVAVPDGPSTP